MRLIERFHRFGNFYLSGNGTRLHWVGRRTRGAGCPGSACDRAVQPHESRKEMHMTALKGTKTEDNLKAAFAGESQANRRYLYFAQKADVEGYNDVAAVFRSTAEGETGHAHGHLEFLEVSGDPATGLPI